MPPTRGFGCLEPCLYVNNLGPLVDQSGCLLRVPTVENWWLQWWQLVWPEWYFLWLEKDSGWWNTLEQISQTYSVG